MELNLNQLTSLMLFMILASCCYLFCPTTSVCEASAANTRQQPETSEAPSSADPTLLPATADSFAAPGSSSGAPEVERTAGSEAELPVANIEAELVPNKAQLFAKDAYIDVDEVSPLDCHLRNLDFCYAGLLSSMGRALPETDADFEVRCDEMRATTNCMAVFNRRCQSFKVFAALAPFGDFSQSPLTAVDAPLPPPVESLLMGYKNESSSFMETAEDLSKGLKVGDLMALCEPQAKQTDSNKALRRRLYQLAKCVNERIPSIRPCIEDLKTALQLFYEPARLLPMQPTCCAIGRFRQCATKALDDICGLSSLDQLEATFATGAGPSIKVIERICRRGLRSNSAYCVEVLPPSGLKAPQRRGRKASKLAKALDLISFAPQAAGQSI